MRFAYADESDRGPYPIPRDAPVEGGRKSDGDRHVIVVDRDHRKAIGRVHASDLEVVDTGSLPHPGR